MELVRNTEIFTPAARELAIRFIQQIATCLHEAPEVAFDVSSDEAAKSELLFKICFLGIAQFEEQSGIQVANTKYTPRVAFDTARHNPTSYILIGNAQVHGMVDAPQLTEGVARSRRRLESKIKNNTS